MNSVVIIFLDHIPQQEVALYLNFIDAEYGLNISIKLTLGTWGLAFPGILSPDKTLLLWYH